MSVTAAELVFYASANMPEDDASTSGGAIDTLTIVVPTSASLFNATGAGFLDYVSANAGDTTQTVTVTGRNAAGSIITEQKTLNGTTVVNGATTFSSIEKIVLSATCAGIVTVTKHTGGATVTTIPVGVKTVRRLFYGASSNPVGGATVVRYEKIFLKNTDATNALLSAQLTETSDPSSVMDYALAASVNDSGSVANRLTAPGGLTFNSSAQNVPGADLAAGAAIGIWCRQTLTAGLAASEYAWGIQMGGSTA